MQFDPVIAVTLLNDPNPEDKKLLVFVQPNHCHNLRLERHDASVLCVADVYTNSIYLLKDGTMYRLPSENRFIHPGSVSFTPVVLFGFDRDLDNTPHATIEPVIKGEKVVCDFLMPPCPTTTRMDVGDSVTRLRKVKQLPSSAMTAANKKPKTTSRIWMLCADCNRSVINNFVPDECDSCHSKRIECMVLEEPIRGSTFPL